jgi:hypothetical protein
MGRNNLYMTVALLTNTGENLLSALGRLELVAREDYGDFTEH